jgi:hypothetical protein
MRLVKGNVLAFHIYDPRQYIEIFWWLSLEKIRAINERLELVDAARKKKEELGDVCLVTDGIL